MEEHKSVKGTVLSLMPFVIDRDRARICQCKDATYEIDAVNRIVRCQECGAILDPFDALVRFAEEWERIDKLWNEYVREANEWKKISEEEFRKFQRYRGISDISKQYRKGMHPVCPQCGKVFDPAEINTYIRVPPVEQNNAKENELERDK